MPRIGEQGDVLRVLGRFFDEQGGTDIVIEAHEPYLTVMYSVAREQSGRRYLQDHELSVLRAQAQSLRSGQGGPTTGGSMAEWLRTLGQELDEARIEMMAIAEDERGFRVSGISNGRYHPQHAFWYELEEAISRHRAKRGSGGGRSAEEIDPYLGVSQGAPVLTRDDERVGSVGATRNRWLQVKTPLFRRNYWLPATCVASARLGQPVHLALVKEEIREHSRKAPGSFVQRPRMAPGAEAWY